MAIRKDYSLTKDFDFFRNLDIYTFGDDFEYALPMGWQSKEVLKYSSKFYKGTCGNDETISRVFDCVDDYCLFDTSDPEYDYATEAGLVKDMYYSITGYEEEVKILSKELDREIDAWLGKQDSLEQNVENKKQDMKYMARVELVLNKRILVFELESLLYGFLHGMLEDCPEEDEDPDSLFSSVVLPMLTHVPCADDINHEAMMDSPLLRVLRYVAIKDSYLPMAIMRDYNNGNVCVRLWKKEDEQYVPFYHSVSKSEVYLNYIISRGDRALWMGLIESAVNELGCKDEYSIAEALYGSAVKDCDMDEIIAANMPERTKATEEYNELMDTYIHCFFDTYVDMLKTNSLFLGDDIAYTQMMFGVREMTYALECCFDRSADVAATTSRLLRGLVLKCRESIANSGDADNYALKYRLSICDTIDELLDLFNDGVGYNEKPREHFQRILAEKVAIAMLKTMRVPLTKEAVENETNAVMEDDEFLFKTAKTDIHSMKHATGKMVQSILECII